MWLLILRSKSVLVNGPLLKENVLKFTNELGFQALEGWLEKCKLKKCKINLDLVFFNVSSQ